MTAQDVSTGPAPRPSGGLRIPPIRLVRSPEEFAEVEWWGDMTLVEIPVECLDAFPFKNDHRQDDPRLKRIVQAIRADGYNNMSPIRVRIGRRGKWVVVDGGHRLTAARLVAREFWPNLFGRKVRTLCFLVQRTPLSNTLLDAADDGSAPEDPAAPGEPARLPGD